MPRPKSLFCAHPLLWLLLMINALILRLAAWISTE